VGRVMNIEEIETYLKSLLQGEYTSFSIDYNDHHINYHDALTEYGDRYDSLSWVSKEDYEKALLEDSVWTIHVYPSFYRIHASSLQVLLDYLKK
jgi:hypothetical protein